MSKIEEVRERLAAISGVAGARVSAESDDIRALLADHARLQAEAAWCRSDEPGLCDICRIHEETRVDAEGIPFCDQCWNETFGSEQPTKGEGVADG